MPRVLQPGHRFFGTSRSWICCGKFRVALGRGRIQRAGHVVADAVPLRPALGSAPLPGAGGQVGDVIGVVGEASAAVHDNMSTRPAGGVSVSSRAARRRTPPETSSGTTRICSEPVRRAGSGTRRRRGPSGKRSETTQPGAFRRGHRSVRHDGVIQCCS
jgi:hypothetical protein